MKYLLIALLLSSCTKQRDWLCTVENVTPEGIIYTNKAVMPFHGTYADMLKFQKAGTFGTPGNGKAWQTTICK